ncbi:MAG: sugar phosphate isomerase/epimerase family protein, partial [Fidelibacterota bacterium]
MARRVKTSVGIWTFGANATRFVPGGYHPEEGKESIEERVKRAVDGLGELVDGYEFHYPGELNEDNLHRVQSVLGDRDIYTLAMGLFSNQRYAHGTYINPDPEIRRETIQITRRGIDLAAEIGSHMIIWPGAEGYNYPFQINYEDAWRWFVDSISEITDYAFNKGVTILLEHKSSEPAMKILMRNVGMTLFVINSVKEKGVDVSKLKVNIDWMHLIMNGENLPEYAALLCSLGLLGHNHANSGWGVFDDDNMVGASYFMQTLALAVELNRYEYGKNGERIGFDLFPYTEDQVEAVRQSILQWE